MHDSPNSFCEHCGPDQDMCAAVLDRSTSFPPAAIAAAVCGDKASALRLLASALSAGGYSVLLRTALGGGRDGASCLCNLRHSFLLCSAAPRAPPAAEAQINSPPQQLSAGAAAQQKQENRMFSSVKVFRHISHGAAAGAAAPRRLQADAPPHRTYSASAAAPAGAPCKGSSNAASAVGAGVAPLQAGADGLPAKPVKASLRSRARTVAPASLLSAGLSSCFGGARVGPCIGSGAAAAAATTAATVVVANRAISAACATATGKPGCLLVVDPNFAAQFEVAHPSPRLAALLAALPPVFVGHQDRLVALVRLLCAGERWTVARCHVHVSTPDTAMLTALKPPFSSLLYVWKPRVAYKLSHGIQLPVLCRPQRSARRLRRLAATYPPGTAQAQCSQSGCRGEQATSGRGKEKYRP